MTAEQHLKRQLEHCGYEFITKEKPPKEFDDTYDVTLTIVTDFGNYEFMSSGDYRDEPSARDYAYEYLDKSIVAGLLYELKNKKV